MPSTLAGARLTEAHRLAQTRLSAVVFDQMRRVWPLYDIEPDGWLTASKAIVNANHSTSSRLAAGYVTAYRTVEIGPDPTFTPELAVPLPDEQISRSLHYTAQNGLEASAASAGRLALEGGRQAVLRTVDADERAQGWARTTSGRCCAFCAMLAGRGPVYREDSVTFRAHDHCHCGAEPVYAGDGWNRQSRRYREMYDQATEGERDPLNAFRRHWESLAA